MDPSLAIRLPALVWCRAMEAGLACGAFFWGLIAPRPAEPGASEKEGGPWQAGTAVQEKIARTKMSVGPADPKSSWTVRSDGSFDPKNGRGGIGAALIDPSGRLVATIAKAVHIGAEVGNGPAVAEYLAATAGLEMALAAGVSEVRLQSDNKCLTMFSAGALRAGVRDDLGEDALSESKKRMLALFPEFSGLCVEWIDRRRNKLADALSKTGTGKGSASEARAHAKELIEQGARALAAEEAETKRNAEKAASKSVEKRVKALLKGKASRDGAGKAEFKPEPSRVLGWKTGSSEPAPERFGAVVSVARADGGAEVVFGGRESIDGSWSTLGLKDVSAVSVEAGMMRAEAVADAAEALAIDLVSKCAKAPRCASVAVSDRSAFELLAARAERMEDAFGEGAWVRFCWHPEGKGALGDFHRQAKDAVAAGRIAGRKGQSLAQEQGSSERTPAPTEARFVVEAAAAEEEVVAIEAPSDGVRPLRRGYLRMKVRR